MTRFLIPFCAALFLVLPASAAEQSPQAFLQSIYVHYEGSSDTAKGVYPDTPAATRRYFEPVLANLIIADVAAAAKRGDVPELDGDPFIDAQDWDITNLKIHIDSRDATKARATVTYENFKKPQAIHLSLVHTPAGWRIADIIWNGNEGTLRGLYVKK